MNKEDKYKDMQKKFYQDPRRVSNPNDLIVGNYEWHEEFPYETFLLYRNGDVRKPIFKNFEKKVAFDFGCGNGRMIRRMSEIFKRVDGCDLNEPLIKKIRKDFPESNLYVSGGDNCGGAKENSYDFVFCTISMQHISNYKIRKKILENIMRILKKDGKFTLQLAYHENPEKRAGLFNAVMKKLKINKMDFLFFDVEINFRNYNPLSLAPTCFGWFESKAAKSTNGTFDCSVSKKSLPFVLKDIGKTFNCITDYWFEDIHTKKIKHSDYWASHWIFFHGEKNGRVKNK